jgi:putative ABC transport system permease protein
MNESTLLWRGLRYHWRTNLAVIAGVATAVAVLAGALLVGDSVRGSLRDLVIGRLGRTERIVAGTNPFRAALAKDLAPDAYAMFGLEGIVAHGSNGRVAAKVAVYGVDEGFWKFHGVTPPAELPNARNALVSAPLAAELGINPQDSVIVRLDKPSEIPAESVHGRKEDTVRALRLTASAVLPTTQLGEFVLRPTQAGVRAVFVSLLRLQRELQQPGKANLVLLGAGQKPNVRDKADLADMAVKVKPLGAVRQLSIESPAMVISEALEKATYDAAKRRGLSASPVLSYLINSIRIGDREVPYSLVSGVANADGAVMNEWAARELKAKPGDRVRLEYWVWHPDGRLDTQATELDLKSITPIAGWAADRDFAPEYPGITEAKTIHDWDPPFPMELGRIRKQDEDYWDRYRTTPKLFLPIQEAEKLWASRFGRLTSIRIAVPEGADLEQTAAQFRADLKASLDPTTMGLLLADVRADSLEAAQGATDFGQYFLYFSFFLMVSALLLVSLFFKLGVEQRYREAGLLRSLGFDVGRIGKLFLKEGAILAAIGAGGGVLLAAGYAGLILYGLRTWWVDAVGTQLLALHLSPLSLIGGALAGWLTALFVIWRSVQLLREPSPRALLQGAAIEERATVSKRSVLLSLACGALGLLLLAASALKLMPAAGGFFGAGMLLLISILLYSKVWLLHGVASPDTIWRLGLRNATYRPGRSVVSMALIAFATFLVIALSAFRQEGKATADRLEGAAGFPLVGESVLPVIYSPNTPEGRQELGFPSDAEALFREARVVPLRLRQGDDASCLNLYQPRNPRVIGLPDDVFFQLPLSKEKLAPNQGEFGAFVDANSLQYVLHKKVGDAVVLDPDSGRPITLRIIGTLHDSIFQSEIVIRDADFRKAFPEQQGFRAFLVDAPAAKRQEITALLEDRLKDYGLDLTSTAEKLAGYHRVENAYLSTFQALGGLGLLLGTVGLAAVLLRNVLERRKELALLRAVGYQPSHLANLVLAENVLLLTGGLLIGTLCAALAIAPAIAERGGHLPLLSMGALLLAVALTGLVSSIAAVRAALRSPLLSALRAD